MHKKSCILNSEAIILGSAGQVTKCLFRKQSNNKSIAEKLKQINTKLGWWWQRLRLIPILGMSIPIHANKAPRQLRFFSSSTVWPPPHSPGLAPILIFLSSNASFHLMTSELDILYQWEFCLIKRINSSQHGELSLEFLSREVLTFYTW